MAPRRLADLLLQVGRDVVDRVPDRRRRLRIGFFKLGAHRSGSRFEQLQKVLVGEIAAPAKRERQLAVALRALGQLVVTGERKARAPVCDHLTDHAAIAAFDQNIGDLFAQLQALGDGKKMLLALGGGVFNQVGIAQLLRVGQHRLGDGDIVVKGERADQPGRSVVDIRQPAGKSCPRLYFDIGREFLQHVIEQRDLFAGIAARAGRKQIGDALQNSLAFSIAAAVATAPLSSSISDWFSPDLGCSVDKATAGIGKLS